MQEYASLAELFDELPRRRNERPAVLSFRREGVDEWSQKRLGEHARRLAAGLSTGDDVCLPVRSHLREWHHDSALEIAPSGPENRGITA